MAFDPDKAVKSFRSLRKSLKPVPKQPSPAQVHELRTRTRRVEALVHALTIGHKKEAGLLLDAVTPIRKKAGDTRDIDVVIGLTAAIPIECEQECLVELIEHLGSKRVKSIRKLRKTLAAQRRKAKLRLKQASHLLRKYSRSSRKNAKESQEWSADVTAAAVEIWSELRSWPRLNSTNLHRFRIQAKELRYILQLSTENSGEFLRTLGEVKDAIGEWHDWDELAAIAAGVLKHGSRCPVVKQMRSTAKQKFDHALLVANTMRSTYRDGNLDWTRMLNGNGDSTRKLT